MGEPNKHIHFSLADIERYLQGNMSASEMHDMEKAALQDPFLADAIEGYTQASLPLAAQHLNQIAASLQQEEGKELLLPGVSIKKQSWQWWKVAAMIIVIAGAGALAWQIMQSPANAPSVAQDLAQTNKQDHPDKAIQPPPPAVPAPADTIRPAQEQPVAVQPHKSKQASKPQSSELAATQQQMTWADSTKQVINPDDRFTKNTVRDNAAPAAAPSAAMLNVSIAKANNTRLNAAAKNAAGFSVPAPSYTTKETADTRMKKEAPAETDKVVVTGYGTTKNYNKAADPVLSNSSYLLSGIVLDNEGKPLAGATVKTVNGHAFSITDEKGKFSIRSMDTAINVEVASIGFETTETAISSHKRNTVQLEDASESLSEMVVTEMATHKLKRGADKNGNSDSTYPSGGWQSFQEYAYKKLHQEMDTTGTDPRVYGEVELEFLVDQDGEPRDVKVIRSYDDTMNQKAIEILKKGPKWVGPRKKKARVIVRY